jgi:antitoxin (DNA-binding transcriptional repressor) of toxin-antitoxin stability system
MESDNLIVMESHIRATEAARSFSDLLNRVSYRGETFVVERGGEPVCRISPATPPRKTVADLVRLLKKAPLPDEGYLKAVEKAYRRQPPLPKRTWAR